MKKTMKKFFTLVLVSLLSAGAFAKSINVGACFIPEIPLGDRTIRFMAAEMGGGVTGQFGLFNLNNMEIGASAYVMGSGILLNTMNVYSAGAMTILGGAYINIPMPVKGLSIAPEVLTGVQYNFLEVLTGAGSVTPKAYADQAVQFGCGVRYALEQLPLTFEVAPFYQILFDSDGPLNTYGFRCSALYEISSLLGSLKK